MVGLIRELSIEESLEELGKIIDDPEILGRDLWVDEDWNKVDVRFHKLVDGLIDKKQFDEYLKEYAGLMNRLEEKQKHPMVFYGGLVR